MLLEAAGLVGGYGGMDILNGVDLVVAEGEVVVVIGPNGAGKSTALKAVFGLVRLRSGRILFQGAEVTGEAPERLVARGLGFVPQDRNVFPNLTVRENLEMGAYGRRGDPGPAIARIFELFPVLAEKRRQPAGQLSGGQRQMVAVGRALMAEPRLLLLDEPTAGLSPRVAEEMFGRLKAVNAAGVGILMVEQNARQALALADRAYVLVLGRNRHEGPAATLLADPEIGRSFLGG